MIHFCKTLKVNTFTAPIIRQVIRSSTSVGANYLEADEAGSKKEFRYRISLAKRETRETQHWLRMLVAAVPEIREKAATFWKEGEELIRIFGTIFRRSDNNKKDEP